MYELYVNMNGQSIANYVILNERKLDDKEEMHIFEMCFGILVP